MSASDESQSAMPVPRKQWKRFTDEEQAEAAKRYREGATVREIAEWLDHPAGSVYLMLKRLGAEFRPRGTPSKATP